MTLIKSLIHSMSTQDLSEQQNGSERDIEEEETLLLDLNYTPPSDNVALESTFTSSSPLELYAKDQRWSNPQATNNVDASDDDVVILSSPRSFLEVIFFSIHSISFLVVFLILFICVLLLFRPERIPGGMLR